MTDTMAQSLIDDLDELLNAERAALLEGDLDTVNRVAERKEALIGHLAAMDNLSRADLAPLQNKVSRNQALIESALEGIRAVAQRIAELRSTRGTLQTYDRMGALRRVTPEPERSVEKRA